MSDLPSPCPVYHLIVRFSISLSGSASHHPVQHVFTRFSISLSGLPSHCPVQHLIVRLTISLSGLYPLTFVHGIGPFEYIWFPFLISDGDPHPLQLFLFRIWQWMKRIPTVLFTAIFRQIHDLVSRIIRLPRAQLGSHDRRFLFPGKSSCCFYPRIGISIMC